MKLLRKTYCLVISFLHAATLLAVDPNSGSLTNGLVAHYSFNQNLSELSSGGSNALTYNNVSSVFDAESGKYVFRVVGKGFTVPSAWWEQEANKGPGGYIQIPRPALYGNKATFSIAIREHAYTMFGGESFLNFYNPQTATGLDLVGHYQMAFVDQEGLYSNDSKIATTERDFYQDSNYGSGGGIIFNNPIWASYQIVVDDGNISLFKNGSLLGQTTGTLPSSGDLWIGKHHWVEGVNKYSTRLVADISDVHVYDRALSNTEVASLAASVLPEPSALSLLAVGLGGLAMMRRRRS